MPGEPASSVLVSGLNLIRDLQRGNQDGGGKPDCPVWMPALPRPVMRSQDDSGMGDFCLLFPNVGGEHSPLLDCQWVCPPSAQGQTSEW